jgi:hypothetical protein
MRWCIVLFAACGAAPVSPQHAPPAHTEVAGGARVADQLVSTVPLDALEAPLGRPLDGILGYDFLSRFIVELGGLAWSRYRLVLDYSGERVWLDPK